MAKQRRGWLVAGAVTAMVLVSILMPAAPARPAAAAPVGPAAVEGFSDVPRSHRFWLPITWMVAKGIATGYTDGTFGPTGTVTRQSLAAFVFRMNGSPATPCSAVFSDVPVSHPFCEEITWMAAEGFITGYPDGTFGPTAAVTRQSFAVALYRAAGAPNGADPTCPSSSFSDVPTSHPFCGEIRYAVNQGITEGYADGTFRPTSTVSRQSAAAFLHRYLGRPVKVDAGSYGGCALISTGRVRCWGQNANGQVGDGTKTQRNVPTAVAGLTDAVDISVGFGHACAVRRGGSVVCWGKNGMGQLGDGSTTDRTTPVAVVDLEGATKVVAGEEMTCAVLTNRQLRCWGENFFTEVGVGLGDFVAVPVWTREQTDVVDVSIGWVHVCVLKTTGDVRCWGSNASGQLGDGTTTTAISPVAVTGVTTGVALDGGHEHTCVVLTAATVRCWGDNSAGQLGDGTTTDRLTPVTAVGTAGAVSVDSDRYHTCATLVSGAVKCWGSNPNGAIGNGTKGVNVITPATVSTLSNAVQATTSSGSSCALLATGGLRCWGRNLEGQVGDGTVFERLIPTEVMGYP